MEDTTTAYKLKKHTALKKVVFYIHEVTLKITAPVNKIILQQIIHINLIQP
jgi:hypothetical protein